jgi:Sucrose-6F-phosphate phosphohydrolase
MNSMIMASSNATPTEPLPRFPVFTHDQVFDHNRPGTVTYVCNCYRLTEVQVFVAGDTTNDIEIVRIHSLAICVPNFDDELDGQREIVQANSVSPQHVRRVGAGIDHFRSPRGVPE